MNRRAGLTSGTGLMVARETEADSRLRRQLFWGCTVPGEVGDTAFANVELQAGSQGKSMRLGWPDSASTQMPVHVMRWVWVYFTPIFAPARVYSGVVAPGRPPLVEPTSSRADRLLFRGEIWPLSSPCCPRLCHHPLHRQVQFQESARCPNVRFSRIAATVRRRMAFFPA